MLTTERSTRTPCRRRCPRRRCRRQRRAGIDVVTGGVDPAGRRGPRCGAPNLFGVPLVVGGPPSLSFGYRRSCSLSSNRIRSSRSPTFAVTGRSDQRELRSGALRSSTYGRHRRARVPLSPPAGQRRGSSAGGRTPVGLRLSGSGSCRRLLRLREHHPRHCDSDAEGN